MSEQETARGQVVYTDRKGVLLIICAPSGAGKSTLIARLMQEFPRLEFSISCTTRQPRAGEIDGVHYNFWDKETFLIRRKIGYFAESACVHGNWYGTPATPLKAALEAGRDMIFDIDVQGAEQLRKSMPGGRYVFILPPSMAVLEERLRRRGTDDDATIARRLAGAAAEIRAADQFDAVVVNQSLDQAYAELRACYMAATLAPALNTRFMGQLLEEC